MLVNFHPYLGIQQYLINTGNQVSCKNNFYHVNPNLKLNGSLIQNAFKKSKLLMKVSCLPIQRNHISVCAWKLFK